MRRAAGASDELRADPLQADAKPFRREGLVHRVTPFISAGLVAMVVFADPAFARSPATDALTVALAVAIAIAALAPIDWNRLPQLTMLPPILLGLFLGISPSFGQARATAIAAVAVG